MGRTRYWLICTMTAGIVAGCTPGAPTAPSAANNSVASAVIVGASLIKYGQTSSSHGPVGGFNPGIVIVAHGTQIQFHNEDNFDHTATSISGSSFPSGSAFTNAALNTSGSDVAQAGWSSGNLTPNAFSQALNTSQLGTYLFGCFYHYGSPMRGVIIVQ